VLGLGLGLVLGLGLALGLVVGLGLVLGLVLGLGWGRREFVVGWIERLVKNLISCTASMLLVAYQCPIALICAYLISFHHCYVTAQEPIG
jgi:hypothetical protein